MSKFESIEVGQVFYANSQPFRKIDRLCFCSLDDPTMERMISPLFDQTIGEKVARPEDMDATAKFIVDPNTRIMRPNPNFDTSIAVKNAALLAFDEFYDTGYFICEPRDVTTMTEAILQLLLIESAPEPGNMDADKKTAKVRTKRAARAVEKKATEKSLAKKAAKKQPAKAQKKDTKMAAKKKTVAKKPANPKYPAKKK